MPFDRAPEVKLDYRRVERRFKAALRAALPWSWGSLQIDVDGDGGGVQFLGNIRPLRPGAPPLGLDCIDPVFDLRRELSELRTASRAEPKGPWYHCKLTASRMGGTSFAYWWEGHAVRGLDDLYPRIDGRFPLFVFVQPLQAAFLVSLPAARAAFAVAERVAQMLRERRAVPEALLEIAAVHDWLTSLGSGGLDQFFLKYEPPGLRSAGVRSFRAVCSGLRRFGFEAAQPVFEEVLRIYAPHLAAAGEACDSLGLEPDSIVAVRDNLRMKQLAAMVCREALGWSAALGQYVLDHAGEIAGYDGAIAAAA